MRPFQVVAALALPLFLFPSVRAQADEILLIERSADRAGRDRLVQTFRKLRMDLRGEDLTAAELAMRLRAATDAKVNFIVSSKKGAIELPTTTFDLRKHPMLSVMATVARATPLRFVYRAGLVQLKPSDEVRELTVLRMYDLTAATARLRDRPGPKLSLRVPDEEVPEAEPDDSGKTLSGFSIDRVQELLQAHVDAASWDRPGVAMHAWNGVLIVRQTERNHAEIRALLREFGVIYAPQKQRSVRKTVKKAARKTRK